MSPEPGAVATWRESVLPYEDPCDGRPERFDGSSAQGVPEAASRTLTLRQAGWRSAGGMQETSSHPSGHDPRFARPIQSLVAGGTRCERCTRSTLPLSLIHISEPTRRTPISYAVFCLKKKNININLNLIMQT